MSSSPPSDDDLHAKQRLEEQLKVVLRELVQERLGVELNARDLAAVKTAIVKAGLAGFRVALAGVVGSHEGVDETGDPVEVIVHPPDTTNLPPDEWAELYGDNDAGPSSGP